jgi:hypothetical protein
MKIREIMSRDPVCCVLSDSAQAVAKILCDRNIGSMPVVASQESRKLVGMITDRDLCCLVMAQGLDPKTTRIEKLISLAPFTCRDGENIETCERLMQEHQVRESPSLMGWIASLASSRRPIWHCTTKRNGSRRRSQKSRGLRSLLLQPEYSHGSAHEGIPWLLNLTDRKAHIPS